MNEMYVISVLMLCNMEEAAVDTLENLLWIRKSSRQM